MDRDSLVNADMLHVAALYGVDERFTNFEKASCAGANNRSASGIDLSNDVSPSPFPSKEQFESALINVGLLDSSLKDWLPSSSNLKSRPSSNREGKDSSNWKKGSSGWKKVNSEAADDATSPVYESLKEKVLALSLPTGNNAGALGELLASLKDLRPGLYKSLLNHPLLSGCSNNRILKRSKASSSSKFNGGCKSTPSASSSDGKDTNKSVGATSTMESGSNAESTPTVGEEVAETVSLDKTQEQLNKEGLELRKKILVSMISKAVAEGSIQSMLVTVLVLYQEQQKIASHPISEENALFTLPVGKLISSLFESLHFPSSNSQDVAETSSLYSQSSLPSMMLDSSSPAKGGYKTWNPFIWNDSYSASVLAGEGIRGGVCEDSVSNYGRSDSLQQNSVIGGEDDDNSILSAGGSTVVNSARPLSASSLGASSLGGFSVSTTGAIVRGGGYVTSDTGSPFDGSVGHGTETPPFVEQSMGDLTDNGRYSEEPDAAAEEDESDLLAQALAMSLGLENPVENDCSDDAGTEEAASASVTSANIESSTTWRPHPGAPSTFASTSTAKNVRMMEQHLRGHQDKEFCERQQRVAVSYPEVPIMSAFAPLIQRNYLQTLYGANRVYRDNSVCAEEENIAESDLVEMPICHIMVALLVFIGAAAESYLNESPPSPATKGNASTFRNKNLFCGYARSMGRLAKSDTVPIQPTALTIMLIEFMLDRFMMEKDEAIKTFDFVTVKDRLGNVFNDDAMEPSATFCPFEQFSPYVNCWSIHVLLLLLRANLSSALDSKISVTSLGLNRTSSAMFFNYNNFEAPHLGDPSRLNSSDPSRLMNRSALLLSESVVKPSLSPLVVLLERILVVCGGGEERNIRTEGFSWSLFSSELLNHILKLSSIDVFSVGFSFFHPTVQERVLLLKSMLCSCPSAADSKFLTTPAADGSRSAASILWSVLDFDATTVANNRVAISAYRQSTGDDSFYTLYKLQHCCLSVCRWNLLRCHSFRNSNNAVDDKNSSVADKWNRILGNSASSDLFFPGTESSNRENFGATKPSGSNSSNSNFNNDDAEKQAALEHLRSILPSGMVPHDSMLERLYAAVNDDSNSSITRDRASRARSTASAAAMALFGISPSAFATSDNSLTPNSSSNSLCADGNPESGSSLGFAANDMPSIKDLLFSRLAHHNICFAGVSNVTDRYGCASQCSSNRFLYYGEFLLLKSYQVCNNLSYISNCMPVTKPKDEHVTLSWDSGRCSKVMKVVDSEGSVDSTNRHTAIHMGPKNWATVLCDKGFDPNSGVHEWVMKINHCDKNHVFVGVATKDADTSSYVGGNSSSWGVIGTKSLWHDRMKLRTDFGNGFGSNSVVFVRLDTNARSLSFSTDNSDWGVAFERLPSTTLYPALSLYQPEDSASIFGINDYEALKAADCAASPGGSLDWCKENSYVSAHIETASLLSSYRDDVLKMFNVINGMLDAVDDTANVKCSQLLLSHPLITVFLPSVCSALSLARSSPRDSDCVQLLPYFTILSKKISHCHEKYFNSGVKLGSIGSSFGNVLDGTWNFVGSSDNGIAVDPYCVNIKSMGMSKAHPNSDCVLHTASSQVVGGKGCLLNGNSACTVTGGFIGTRLKTFEAWSADGGTCVVEGRISLDGGYFIGKYKDCKPPESGIRSRRVANGGFAEAFCISRHRATKLSDSLLLRVAYMCTMVCGKYVGALVVGLSSLAFDRNMLAGVEENFSNLSPCLKPSVSLTSVDSMVASNGPSDESSPLLSDSTPLSEVDMRKIVEKKQNAIVLQPDEIKWLQSDLLSGGLPMNAELREYLLDEVLCRTGLSNLKELAAAMSSKNHFVESPDGELFVYTSSYSDSKATVELLPAALKWWISRAFPLLSPLIAEAGGDAMPATEGRGIGSEFGLNSVAKAFSFVEKNIVTMEPFMPSCEGVDSSVPVLTLDEYVSMHISQSSFSKLGGKPMQLARRRILAALIKHSGSASLCMAEYEAVCIEKTKNVSELPCELLLEVWRATNRIIEHWIRQKGVLRLAFDEIGSLLSSKARFLFDLQTSASCDEVENHISMIPVSLISVSSELRKQPLSGCSSGTAWSNVRDIERQGSRLLNEAASFLTSPILNLSRIKIEMMKSSFRAFSRSAGFKASMLLHSKTEDFSRLEPTLEESLGAKKKSQLLPLTSLVLQPLVSEFVVFGLYGMSNVLEQYKRISLPRALGSGLQLVSTKSESSSPAPAGGKGYANSSAFLLASAEEKRAKQDAELSACNGHYFGGLKGCNAALLDEVKSSFVVLYEYGTQLLERCVWGNNKDGQCIMLASWGVSIFPSDHLFLNRVGIFRILQSILDDCRSTLSAYSLANKSSVVDVYTIMPSVMYINCVKRLSQEVLRLVHSLASQVAFSPDSNSPTATITEAGSIKSNFPAPTGGVRLQRLPSGPNTLSSALFDLLYSELYNGIRNVISVTIKESEECTPVEEDSTLKALLSMDFSSIGDQKPSSAVGVALGNIDASFKVPHLVHAANYTVLSVVRSSSASYSNAVGSSGCLAGMDVLPNAGKSACESSHDVDYLTGEQYIYRMLRLLHSVANSSNCQKHLCSAKWFSLLIAGIGCGGLGMQRRLLKLLRRLLVLSGVRDLKAFVSSLYSGREEFKGDTPLNEEDINELIAYQCENDFATESEVVDVANIDLASSNVDYWGMACNATERIVVVLLESASSILPMSSGLLNVGSLLDYLHSKQLASNLSTEALSFLRVLQGCPDWRGVIRNVVHRYLSGAAASQRDSAKDARPVGLFAFDDELQLRMVAMSLGLIGGHISGCHPGGMVNLRPFCLVGSVESYSLKLASVSHSSGMLVGKTSTHADVVLMEHGMMYATIPDHASGGNRIILQHTTSMPATIPLKPVRLSADDVLPSHDVPAIPEFISDVVFNDLLSLMKSMMLPALEALLKKTAPVASESTASVTRGDSAVEYVGTTINAENDALHVGSYGESGEDNAALDMYNEEDYCSDGDMEEFDEEDEDEEEEDDEADFDNEENIAFIAEDMAGFASESDSLPSSQRQTADCATSNKDTPDGVSEHGDVKESTSVLTTVPEGPLDDCNDKLIEAMKILTVTYGFRALSNSLENISLVKILLREHPEMLNSLLSVATSSSSCGGVAVLEMVENRWALLWEKYVELTYEAATAPTEDPIPVEEPSVEATPVTKTAEDTVESSSNERTTYGGLFDNDSTPPSAPALRRETSSQVLPPGDGREFGFSPRPMALRPVDPMMLQMMMEMGLQQDWCEFALRRCRNNVEMAINLCFEQSADMDQLIADEAASIARMEARARAQAASAASASTTYNSRRSHRASSAVGSGGRGGGSGASDLFSRMLQRSNQRNGGSDNSRLEFGDGNLMASLIEMGLPPNLLVGAMAASGNDADTAMRWIASHSNEIATEGDTGDSSNPAGMSMFTDSLRSSSVSPGGDDMHPESKSASIAESTANPLVCVSGNAIIEDNLMCTTSPGDGFPSVGVRGFPVNTGKWYFEVVLHTAGCLQIGWADLAFIGGSHNGEGVGDDAHSWAFDGWRVCGWHEKAIEWGAVWKVGDVVGCGVDFDNGTISYYLNGHGEAIGMGVAYRDVKFCGGMYPCASFTRRECIQFNFGATAFKYAAPEGYSAYSDNINAILDRSLKASLNVEKFYVNISEILPCFDKSRNGRELPKSLFPATVLAESDNIKWCDEDVYNYVQEDCMEEHRGELDGFHSKRYFPQEDSSGSRLFGNSGNQHAGVGGSLRFPTAKFASDVPSPLISGSGTKATRSAVLKCRENVLAQFMNTSKDLCILYSRISLLRAIGAFALVGCPDAFLKSVFSDSNVEKSKAFLMEMLYLIRLSSMYSSRTRVYLRTMSLLPPTGAIPTNIGSVCCAGGCPTLYVLRDSLQALLHHGRGLSNGSTLIEMMLSHIRVDTSRAVRREFMNDFKTDEGFVAINTKNDNGSHGHVMDIDCLIQPDLSLAVFYSSLLLEHLARDTYLNSTEENAVKWSNCVRWLNDLCKCWCHALKSPSIAVKLCSFRFLSVLIQEVSARNSRFGYCGERGTIAQAICHGFVQVLPLERLEAMGLRRMREEQRSLPICSEFLQSLLEFLVSVRALCRIFDDMSLSNSEYVSLTDVPMVSESGCVSSLKIKCSPGKSGLPPSINDDLDCEANFDWENDSGRTFSDGGWVMWTGTVRQLPVSWSLSDHVPSLKSTSSESRRNLPPALLPGCHVVSKTQPPVKAPGDKVENSEYEKPAAEVTMTETASDAVPPSSEAVDNDEGASLEGVGEKVDSDQEDEESNDEDDNEERANLAAEDVVSPSLHELLKRVRGAASAKSKDESTGGGDDCRRGVVTDIVNWTGSSNCLGSPVPVGKVGNARVVRWSDGELEVVRWGAENEYDVVQVAVESGKTLESDCSDSSSLPKILKRYPDPKSAKEAAADKLFGTDQTFGVILRLREVSFSACGGGADKNGDGTWKNTDCGDSCKDLMDDDSGVVAKYDGVMEWPDFNTIVYVRARKFEGKSRELEICEQRLLTPSEGNVSSWMIRFGVDKWQPTTFYLTPKNMGDSSVVEEESPRSTASTYFGQFSYKTIVGDYPGESVMVAGDVMLQQACLFTFDEQAKNKNYSVSHAKTMAANNSGGGRGIVFGSVGFSVGVHYWEMKIEHCDMGSLFMGVCEKPVSPGVGFHAQLQQLCTKWYGSGYINHRTSYSRNINNHSSERLAVYGDHFQSGDTVGVLLDMNRGKLYFFLDGMKFGEHTIQNLGEAASDLKSPSSVVWKTYYPVVGFQKSSDRVVITPRWLSSIGADAFSDLELVNKAYKLLDNWSVQRSTQLPLKSDMWVYRDSWRDWRKWLSGRYLRVRARCDAACISLVVDTLPLSCMVASLHLGLSTALFHGDRIVFHRTCGKKLETKEEAVILGAYRNQLWYRLDNQTSGDNVSESAVLAWCLAPCDIEGVSIIKRCSGDRNLEKCGVYNIVLPRLPQFVGGRLSINYNGGAVIRDGLEIDAADVLCSLPNNAIVYATEKRMNSSNIMRYRVVYEGVYGYISERMRGGTEEMMVTYLHSTEEELNEAKAEARVVIGNYLSDNEDALLTSPGLTVEEKLAMHMDCPTVPDVDSGVRYWLNAVEELHASNPAVLRKLLGPGGRLTDGFLPNSELTRCSHITDHSKSHSFSDEPGYSFEEYVELASRTHSISGSQNWCVEADMQLCELMTRFSNRERVTPQNLCCITFERSLQTVDLEVVFPKLHGIPVRALLARASLLRVANQIFGYALPYLSVALPEEKLMFNRRGAFSEITAKPSVTTRCGDTGDTFSHIHPAGCSSCENASSYNAVDYGKLEEASGNSVDRFPSDSGIEVKLRDISETWLPICSARRLRSLRRLVFSHTKSSFWESVIDATTTPTALPQDEYEVSYVRTMFLYFC